MQTDSGFSLKRLERLSACLQRYVDHCHVAGSVALIARCGQVVYSRQFGLADIESGRPMASDTIFRIHSMTKPITCAALLMLMEEGRLRLSDPLWLYLPAFKDMKVMGNCSDPQRQSREEIWNIR